MYLLLLYLYSFWCKDWLCMWFRVVKRNLVSHHKGFAMIYLLCFYWLYHKHTEKQQTHVHVKINNLNHNWNHWNHNKFMSADMFGRIYTVVKICVNWTVYMFRNRIKVILSNIIQYSYCIYDVFRHWSKKLKLISNVQCAKY